MGKGFGQGMARAYGLIQYTLSPFEQNAWAGSVTKGIPNLVKRFAQSVFKVAPRKNFSVCSLSHFGLRNTSKLNSSFVIYLCSYLCKSVLKIMG